jgi:hypothetical protein
MAGLGKKTKSALKLSKAPSSASAVVAANSASVAAASSAAPPSPTAKKTMNFEDIRLYENLKDMKTAGQGPVGTAQSSPVRNKSVPRNIASHPTLSTEPQPQQTKRMVLQDDVLYENVASMQKAAVV